MADMMATIFVESWDTLREMAPYLLFGFGVAGILSVFVSPEVVERHLGGGGFWPVVKATLFGIPLPLCSCGVIPVSASLRRHGATRGATISFLLSTPQTGVDSIMVTLGLLGPVFALFRPIVALVTGLVGGGIANLVDRGLDEEEGAERCQEACCTGGEGGSRAVRAFRYAFVTLPNDIGKALLIGLVIVGLLSAFVPDDFFAGLIGGGIGAMVVMMLVGLPMYVCATASVPIAAALIAKGVSPGAAFVFLMTGPATNAAAASTIWKLMGARTTIAYLLTVIVAALVAGLALDAIIGDAPMVAAAGMGRMLPVWLKNASAVILLLMLAKGLWPRGAKTADEHDHPAPGGQILLKVKGMTCSHCREAVERALKECTGVRSVQVDLSSGQARVQGEAMAEEALVQAVEGAGYSAQSIEST